jgi:hypothetical protein
MASGEQEDNRIDETLQKLKDTMSEKMNLYGDIQNEFGILANEIRDHKRGQQFAGAIIALAAGMEELYGITHDLAKAYADVSIKQIRDKT